MDIKRVDGGGVPVVVLTLTNDEAWAVLHAANGWKLHYPDSRATPTLTALEKLLQKHVTL